MHQRDKFLRRKKGQKDEKSKPDSRTGSEKEGKQSSKRNRKQGSECACRVKNPQDFRVLRQYVLCLLNIVKVMVTYNESSKVSKHTTEASN